MLKKTKLIISLLIISMVLFSIYFMIFIIKPEESNETIIKNDENSIFNGYTPREIAQKIATAVDEGKIISEDMETHHSNTLYKYETQYQSAINIHLYKNEFFGISGAPISFYSNKVPGINISNNPSKGIDLVFGIWERFLNSLDYQLTDDNYNISINSQPNWSGRVYIRQTCNNNIPLSNTGVSANIIEEDSQINSMRIYDWSRIKIERSTNVTFDDSINIITSNTPNVTYNRSDLDFKGYSYFSEKVHYRFNLEIPLNSTKDKSKILMAYSATTYENGTTVYNKMEQWIGYNFYINVENGEFESNEYGLSKIIQDT